MGRWIWAAASRRGLSHALVGEARQDAQRAAAALDGSVIVAIACDGAGSASHGGLGANLAARVLARCAQAHFACRPALPGGDDMASWFHIARHVIAGAAKCRGLSFSDLATTAVMAVSDGACTMTAHVGDGAILAREVGVHDDDAGAWHALSWPEHGEYVSTTFFMTDADLKLRTATHAMAADRLVVMTDGLERVALDFGRATPHAPYLEGLCKPLVPSAEGGCDMALSKALARYLDSNAVNRRTDDDKTLILAAVG